MTIGLTAQEYTFLAVAVGPAVLAVVVVRLVLRWAKPSEQAQRQQQ